MKLLFAIILFISINFSGCYTILWTPDQDFPTEESYYGGSSGYSGYDDGYYSDPYYGGYGYYYEYPWWLTMAPPTRSIDDRDEKSERYEAIRDVRNNGSGRNNDDTRVSSPTRSSNTNTTTPSGSSTQSTETQRSNNSSDSSKSEDRSKVRSSGERNSGGGRK